MELDYASKGQGNLGVTLGAIGTGLSLLSGGTNLLGMARNTGTTSEDHTINRYEFDMQMNYEKQLSAQQLQIASLEAEKISDAKDIEVYKQLKSELTDVNDRLQQRIVACEVGIANQAVYNATNTSTIGCIQNQIAQLQSMTKLVIPNASVMPGWGNVTITPATAATTTTTT